jgi:type IV secretion system protein VirD4
MHYNPFKYIRSERDILKLVNTIIANTKGEGDKSGEDFWVKAERLYYCALIGYIWYEAPEEEQNFSTLLEFINASEAREDDEEFKNAVDLLFEELEINEPQHFAVRQYKKYKLAAGKTAKSILISCGARLAPFDIQELRDLMSYDEMELDMLGDQKTAMFVIISDTDDTFNFVVAIMYTQLFNLLCDKADDEHGGRLPYHVRLLLDEFANIGQIPKFDKLIATIRSREISASIILQSQSQLKSIYKDAAETIIGNCDTTLFLGGKESSTLKEISETLGKETIDLMNTSDTRGQSRSYGLNYQKTGKELMSKDELAVMDGNKCILQVRGVRPFFSDKFDITRHKRYRELSDYDKRNAFDVEKYMRCQLRMRADEEVEVFNIQLDEADIE